jgi:hypothetical protein
MTDQLFLIRRVTVTSNARSIARMLSTVDVCVRLVGTVPGMSHTMKFGPSSALPTRPSGPGSTTLT